MTHTAIPCLALALGACAPGAAPDSGSGGEALLDQPVADFVLEDLNPHSPRAGDAITPRDYLGAVSGWYFIHST